MATLTITSSSFGGIGAVVQGDVPATLTIDIGVPGPAGPGLPAGGLEGQIIVKNSSAIDYDTEWVDNYSQTVQATVRNQTGSTLTKGTVVYISGGAGNKPLVTKASATSESSSSKTFAILAEDILNNQNGQATTLGLLKGIDTSSFGAGANLWLSTTAGQITATMPTSPNHAVFLGNVVRVNSTDGEIEVRIQNGYELGELHDVLITTPSNGQVLKYESATGLWKNQTDLNSGVWGSITGTLSSQTDLQSALDGKAPVGNYLVNAGDATSLNFQADFESNRVLLSKDFGIKIQGSNKIEFNDSTLQETAYQPGLVLLKADNLSGLANTATARTNLGLGTMATATASDYLAKAGNLSGLANVTTARNNLGLGADDSVAHRGVSGTFGTAAFGSTVNSFSITSQPSSQSVFSSIKYWDTEFDSPLIEYAYDSNFGIGFSASKTNYDAIDPQSVVATNSIIFNADTCVLSIRKQDSTASPSLDTQLDIEATGITFPDATVQTTAAFNFDPTGYATESWVSSQGYLTSGDLTGYAELSGAAFTGAISVASGFNQTTVDATTVTLTDGTDSLTLSAFGGSSITFSDSTVQTTAFPGFTGYAPLASPTFTGDPKAPTPATSDNDTSIATTAFVKAQGYLTTAPVTSVAGKTGAVTLTNSDISGLGTMATATATDYLAKADNLSGLANTGTARTNLGLGTMATETAADYALLASPALTGTPTSTTAAADTNTTQIATTAYVIGQASSTTPAATGTAAVGTSLKYARADHVHANPLPTGGTTGQVLAKVDGADYNVQWSTAGGGSTTYASIEDTLGVSIDNEALSPKMIPYIMGLPGFRSMNGLTSSSITGSGAGVGTYGWTRGLYFTTNPSCRATYSTTGYGLYGSQDNMSSKTEPRSLNFSKKCAIWGTFTNGRSQDVTLYGSTNSFLRVNLGGRAGAYAIGDITQKGIGLKMAGGGSSNVFLTVHNGTTRTDVDTGYAPASLETVNYFIFSDGSGNVTLYLNGVQKATTSAGPTGTTTNNYNNYEEQIDGNSSSNVRYQCTFCGCGIYIEL